MGIINEIKKAHMSNNSIGQTIDNKYGLDNIKSKFLLESILVV